MWSSSETRTELRTDITPASIQCPYKGSRIWRRRLVVSDGIVYFSNFSDQRLYRQEGRASPEALTGAGDMRYAEAA